MFKKYALIVYIISIMFSFFGEAIAKMAILAQSGRGFLNHTRFARDCLTFLEVCAQAVPQMSILDGR